MTSLCHTKTLPQQAEEDSLCQHVWRPKQHAGDFSASHQMLEEKQECPLTMKHAFPSWDSSNTFYVLRTNHFRRGVTNSYTALIPLVLWLLSA